MIVKCLFGATKTEYDYYREIDLLKRCVKN